MTAVGADLTLHTNTILDASVSSISSSAAIVCYTNSLFEGICQVLQISGSSSFTAGTSLTVSSGNDVSTHYMSVASLTASRAIVCYSSGAAKEHMFVLRAGVCLQCCCASRSPADGRSPVRSAVYQTTGVTVGRGNVPI